MKPREIIKFVAALAVAGLLLWWVIRGTDPGLLWTQLGKASITGLLLCALLNVGHCVFRVWRWRAILAPIREDVAFRPMFTAVILGYMTSWVVPGRLGEVVRPLLLSGEVELPLGPLIGSVVADRMFDAASVVVLFAVGIWVTPLEGQVAEYADAIRATSAVMALGVVIVLGGMVALSGARPGLVGWINRRSGALRWFGRSALSVAGGARAVRSPALMVKIVFHSLLAWLAIALGTWIGVRAAGVVIPFGTMLLILPMLALGIAVPLPGGVGSYHGAMKAGLMLFGASELLATSAAVLVHVTITIPFILLGMVLIWTEGVSWRRLLAGARQLRHLGHEIGLPPQGGSAESPP
jgi:uncharacterized membrane protein YbhN (UPF0104 family)